MPRAVPWLARMLPGAPGEAAVKVRHVATDGRGQTDGIASVVARMDAIAARLEVADGVAHFNDLYLAVTRAVGEAARSASFEDVDGIVRVDVAFAELYFDAVAAADAGAEPARAWTPLFAARRKQGIAAIQFALAGMNAHINFDLASALAALWEQDGRAPGRDSPQFRDYRRVDGILADVEEQVKARFATGLVGVLDEALGRLDDVLAMWKVKHARGAAWNHAEVLWALRREPRLRARYEETLGRMVGLAGRGLLVPTL